MLKKIFFLLLILICSARISSAQIYKTQKGLVVTNIMPEFKFLIPHGYTELPREFIREQGNWIYGFMEHAPTVDTFFDNVSIRVAFVGTIMDDENVELNDNELMASKKSELPKDSTIKFEKIKSGYFKINAVIANYVIDGKHMTSTDFYVPLTQQALHFSFIAPEYKEEKMRLAIRIILNSIEGTTLARPIVNQFSNFGKIILGIICAILIYQTIIKIRAKEPDQIKTST
ncbi:MAG: hypothetical protein K8S27_05400 [Candidatus Omnitrophica bacterium]|nr:hypothetical protein [Candidatus Omnitrophota bacterium]